MFVTRMLKLSQMGTMIAATALQGACDFGGSSDSASDDAQAASEDAVLEANANDDDAQPKGPTRTDGTLESLKVGQFARVVYSLSSPNDIARIEVSDEMPPPRRHGKPPKASDDASEPSEADLAARGVINGAITAIDVAAGSLTVLGGEILTDERTDFVGVEDVSELAVGMSVHIDGALNADGDFVARRIEVELKALAGKLTAVTLNDAKDAGTVELLGRTLNVTSDVEVIVITMPARPDDAERPGKPQGGHKPPPRR